MSLITKAFLRYGTGSLAFVNLRNDAPVGEELIKIVGHSILIIRKPYIRTTDKRFFGKAAEVLTERDVS